MPRESESPSIRVPALWIVIAGVHVAAAILVWHLLPGGFPGRHPRFWTNEVIPVVLVAVAAACLFGFWRRRTRVAAFAIAWFAGFHVGMAPAWILTFHVSGTRPAVISGVIAAAVGTCAFVSLRRVREWSVAAGAAAGFVLGAWVPWSQRGPAPATHPAEAVRALEQLGTSPPTAPPDWVHPSPETAAWTFDAGPVRVTLRPLLTFWSRSPDRGWTVFADADQRIGPPRRFAGASGDAFYYTGDEPGIVRVSATDDVLHVDAEALLPRAVYSHLNTFCELEVSGHHHLFLAFSPAASARIEVTHSDYPVGRPERFAYVDGAHELHVVEAESGEKGPFTELAHGPLPADGKLAITLFDDTAAIAQIELADFAAQVSTQPSPTAGWGVPENALEFSLSGERPDSPAAIFITLAGTSVGRGWDSVGHAAGIYRNRIDVRRHMMAP